MSEPMAPVRKTWDDLVEAAKHDTAIWNALTALRAGVFKTREEMLITLVLTLADANKRLREAFIDYMNASPRAIYITKETEK